MHRQEVASASMIFGFGLPLAGWAAGAYLEQMPFLPFPAGLRSTIHETWHNPVMASSTVASAVVAGALVYYFNEYLDDGFRGERFVQHLRGTRMRNWHHLKTRINSRNAKTNRERRSKKLEKLDPVMIGRVPMPLHLEDRNTMICASIGAGKSVTMEGMIASSLKRGDKMAVVDPNGTFYSKFGFKGDIILNPFDTRTAGWTLFNEIKGVHDFDRMAKSVIPPQVEADSEQWCSYARDVLADTMRKLVETGNPSQDTLVNILVREDGETIRAFLANTDSQGYFRDNAEKAVASIQFMMNKYVRPLRFMSKGDFSLHRWVHDPDAGNLFITWREDMRATMQPLVAMWIDTICATILSYEPMTGKRLWLYLDELQSIGKLESFVPAATKGRKHGLRIVGTIQDWSQLNENYGIESAKTLLSCFRNYVILAAANAETALMAQRVLGKQEVRRMRTSMTAGRPTRAAEIREEFVVMDSEISNLDDLEAFVSFGESYPMARIKLPYVNHKERNAPIMITGVAA
ncbi:MULTISPECIES: type IV secretion system DNA-binding domain-containing protein [Pseudomonas]|uniref:IncW plasmid conjugative protein TrwB (TraD-like protein) n=1 Tax=Pseudomonas syringae pv. actinidiae TaxID=103796 RepID=A0A2P0QFL5_PSESF|nr:MULTISPECIES: type IV secretion system DNA-binding domain-containing protein [Pseudomonas]APQ06930.1 TrwB protein [Pseudomonas syringae pv. actinidiae]ARO44989.1 IncW plasmid conjugative protein TrwB (TraD-like protein) [Pseudomonas syringae pv. actinidiae]ARO45094.1 IncW plasmid conjugative protein TrwB (TraD-like protein) [Pseudomonas syringae pv. actinidiae]ARO45185.1 IncW plasmid conjugative protein TrwB (TraD-like protein) [Pseudomonas syringae pv. actinidiae]MDU8387942.1 type IV secre